jgi:hypothetical protein
MVSSETGSQLRSIHPPTRWVAFGGICFMVLRSMVYKVFPNFLPSSGWRPEAWREGVWIAAVFELILLTALIGVPFCIYYFRSRYTSSRDLLLDCAAAGTLYLTALFLF